MVKDSATNLIALSVSLSEKCPYSEFFWCVFSRIKAEYGEILDYLSVFSPNAGKYRPEKLQIEKLFMQCIALCGGKKQYIYGFILVHFFSIIQRDFRRF